MSKSMVEKVGGKTLQALKNARKPSKEEKKLESQLERLRRTRPDAWKKDMEDKLTFESPKLNVWPETDPNHRTGIFVTGPRARPFALLMKRNGAAKPQEWSSEKGVWYLFSLEEKNYTALAKSLDSYKKEEKHYTALAKSLAKYENAAQR